MGEDRCGSVGAVMPSRSSAVFVSLGLLTAGVAGACGPVQGSGGPPTAIAEPPVATTSTGEVTSTPSPAASTGTATVAPSAEASAADTTSAAPPGPEAAPEPSTSAAGGATFHCFSWVHGMEFSTDCYRTAAECSRERQEMRKGARDTTECRTVQGGACTRVSRPPAPGDHERCFASAGNCERYRAYVQGNGLTVTPCVDR